MFRCTIEALLPDVTSLAMLGGLAFMVRGNMCCGVIGDESPQPATMTPGEAGNTPRLTRTRRADVSS